MKKWFALLLACLLLTACVLPAAAADGNVTYSGNAGEFIFEPGSSYSLTDLFPEYKDVMPGDSLIQPITVRNDASKKVRIYLRALGAHEDSVDFLSQLHLRVEKDEDDVLFDAPADETAQLTDWVCLGTLRAGGEVDLQVILDVPVELDNRYQNLIGYLDWEFMVQEIEIKPDDPVVPDPDIPDVPDTPDTPSPDDPELPYTGDDMHLWLWVILMLMSLCAIVILIVGWKRREREET